MTVTSLCDPCSRRRGVRASMLYETVGLGPGRAACASCAVLTHPRSSARNICVRSRACSTCRYARLGGFDGEQEPILGGVPLAIEVEYPHKRSVSRGVHEPSSLQHS